MCDLTMCLRTASIVPPSEGSVKEETIGDAEGVAARLRTGWSRTTERKEGLWNQTRASWNQVASWLRQIETLRPRLPSYGGPSRIEPESHFKSATSERSSILVWMRIDLQSARVTASNVVGPAPGNQATRHT